MSEFEKLGEAFIAQLFAVSGRQAIYKKIGDTYEFVGLLERGALNMEKGEEQ